jgi:hypothetical protein
MRTRSSARMSSVRRSRPQGPLAQQPPAPASLGALRASPCARQPGGACARQPLRASIGHPPVRQPARRLRAALLRQPCAPALATRLPSGAALACPPARRLRASLRTACAPHASAVRTSRPHRLRSAASLPERRPCPGKEMKWSEVVLGFCSDWIYLCELPWVSGRPIGMERPDSPALGFLRDGPNGPNAQIGLRV